MNIRDISKQINDNAIAKGFWDKNFNLSEKLMLVVSEIAEAQEADRTHKYMQYSIAAVNGWVADDDFKIAFEKYVKDTFEDELADAVIRLFDLAFHLRIDLTAHIQAKHRYNKMRPVKHGKKY